MVKLFDTLLNVWKCKGFACKKILTISKKAHHKITTTISIMTRKPPQGASKTHMPGKGKSPARPCSSSNQRVGWFHKSQLCRIGLLSLRWSLSHIWHEEFYLVFRMARNCASVRGVVIKPASTQPRLELPLLMQFSPLWPIWLYSLRVWCV